MSRSYRLRRGPDQWRDPHERARARLAERLDGPLGLAESAWLDDHLASCPACAAVAAEYEQDRLALRSLRDQPPEPPRDLWARTAAAIEASGGAAGQTREASVRRSLPLGALSGVAVVVIMVGVGLATANLPLGPSGGVKGEESPIVGVDAGATPTVSLPPLANATPIAVDPEDVGYVSNDAPGTVYNLSVDEVCPAGDKADCPAREGTQLGTVFSEAPKAILASPTKHKAVAIANTAAGTDEVVVVDLPEATQRPRPSPTATASASVATSPSPTPTAAASASSEPSGTPAPTASATTSPSPTPSLASIEPSATPSATAGAIAIASGIRVVGESAAFSPDGTWFAFTARAAKLVGGADVYAWRVGSDQAVRVTDDGASYFASWAGNELVVSRPTDRSGDEADAVSVLIDPSTRAERDAGDAWRPAVDPTGTRAIVWVGSLKLAKDAPGWTPDKGTLELRSWSSDGAGHPRGPERDRVVTDSAPRDFDVRWDETGEWVAVWVADGDDKVVGRLTLFHVDTEKERLERVDGAPIDVRALPGFSMGDGRLAWATPRGQGGEGSRIQIAAWSKTDVGIVESNPGEDPVVIR